QKMAWREKMGFHCRSFRWPSEGKDKPAPDGFNNAGAIGRHGEKPLRRSRFPRFHLVSFHLMKDLLNQAVDDLVQMLPKLRQMDQTLQKLGEAMLTCWNNRGRVLVAGNGGSAADSMHLAEELSVRFQKNRKALATIALCDPTAITCAGNDFGF